MNDRLSVVYVDHCARLSGGEIALARLLPALADRVDAHVVLGEDGPLVERLVRLGISVEVLQLSSRVRDLRKDTVATGSFDTSALVTTAAYSVRLAARLRRLRPDLVHTNSLKAALYGGVAGRLARVPVVWHVRDRIADDYLPARAVSLVRRASRLLPSAIVTNSQATLDTLPRRRRSAVVPNAVVADAVALGDAARIHEEGRLRVGVVGRLAPWKGQHVFLDAFARAFPDGDAVARIVGAPLFGEEAYAEELRAQADRLGISDRVDFRGFREDVWAEFAELDVLVHCSVTPEPFGQVVVEGMAAGLPVIAAAAGGPAEVVTDGVDGLLVPPDDVEALTTALRRLADEPALRAQLGAAGRRTAIRFSPDRTAAGVLAVYDAVLHRGRKTREPRTQRR